jgi:hypothetical protein
LEFKDDGETLAPLSPPAEGHQSNNPQDLAPTGDIEEK